MRFFFPSLRCNLWSPMPARNAGRMKISRWITKNWFRFVNKSSQSEPNLLINVLLFAYLTRTLSFFPTLHLPSASLHRKWINFSAAKASRRFVMYDSKRKSQLLQIVRTVFRSAELSNTKKIIIIHFFYSLRYKYENQTYRNVEYVRTVRSTIIFHIYTWRLCQQPKPKENYIE